MTLPSNLIPQANSLDRLVEFACHIAIHGATSLPDSLRDSRDLACYRSALRLLGWDDDQGFPPPASTSFATTIVLPP